MLPELPGREEEVRAVLGRPWVHATGAITYRRPSSSTRPVPSEKLAVRSSRVVTISG